MPSAPRPRRTPTRTSRRPAAAGTPSATTLGVSFSPRARLVGAADSQCMPSTRGRGRRRGEKPRTPPPAERPARPRRPRARRLTGVARARRSMQTQKTTGKARPRRRRGKTAAREPGRGRGRARAAARSSSRGGPVRTAARRSRSPRRRGRPRGPGSSRPEGPARREEEPGAAPTDRRRERRARDGMRQELVPGRVATRPWDAKAARRAPATVQTSAQATAPRKFETPLPTRVAIPFEMSFAPFAKASNTTRNASLTSPWVRRPSAAPGRAGSRGSRRSRGRERAVAVRLENAERAGVRGVRELRRGVGADLDREAAREGGPLLVEEGLAGPS